MFINVPLKGPRETERKRDFKVAVKTGEKVLSVFQFTKTNEAD